MIHLIIGISHWYSFHGHGTSTCYSSTRLSLLSLIFWFSFICTTYKFSPCIQIHDIDILLVFAISLPPILMHTFTPIFMILFTYSTLSFHSSLQGLPFYVLVNFWYTERFDDRFHLSNASHTNKEMIYFIISILLIFFISKLHYIYFILLPRASITPAHWPFAIACPRARKRYGFLIFSYTYFDFIFHSAFQLSRHFIIFY